MVNGVLFQSFEWDMPSDGKFYDRLGALAEELAERGIDAVWLPPACKATSVNDVGYGIYDLYDLGEFEQKGARRTKYGTKEQLMDCIDKLHKAGLFVYMDVVLNHKAGADFKESFQAVPVDPENRNQEIGEPREIEGWTGFDFPGRNKKYSDFTWHYPHFSGVDYDEKSGENGIFRILGENKGWAYGVSNELGNFDYLMFADIDHNHPDVKKHLFDWCKWFIDETGCDGFRMDAVKHIDDYFLKDFSEFADQLEKDRFYLFGEYWNPDLEHAGKYLYETKYNMDIFDVGLHFHLQAASQNENYDLRTLFDNTVVKEYPLQAVTFVDNHDSQPGQSLESWVGRHFKERAYALILLRRDGYPCVFAGDYYGIPEGPSPQEDLQYDINRLLELRANFAYGEQDDYFVDPGLIGWTRRGDGEHPGLMAVLLSMKDEGEIEMNFGPENAGCVFRDYLDRFEDEVQLDEEGKGIFKVKGASLSCWCSRLEAEDQDRETTLKSIEERSEQEKIEG